MVKRPWLAAILALLALGCGGGDAGSSAPPPIVIPEGDDSLMPLSMVHDLDFGQTYTALAVTDHYVYACVPAFGLQVAKMNGPAELSLVVAEGTFPDGTGCRTIAAAPDDMLFMAGQSMDGGSWVASLADGTATSDGELPVLDTVEIPGTLVEDILATQTHVFVVAGDQGLRVFERNGGKLTEVGGLIDGFDQALGLDSYGSDKLVIGNGPSGLAIVDISSPSSPAIVKSFKTFGVGRKVSVNGDFAYVAAVAGGVSVHDLTADNPYPPLSSWSTHSSTMDIAVTDEGLAFVANWEDLVVLDVSEPSAIKFAASELIQSSGASSKVAGVVAEGNIGYVADWSAIGTFVFAADREAPDIHLSKTKVKFGMVSIKKGKTILIRNFGAKDLEVTDVSCDNPLFTIDVKTPVLTVESGDIDYLEVTFQPTDDSEVKANLTLNTNDPDEGTISIPLSANVITGKQVGGPFDGEEPLIYQEVNTGKDVTVIGEHAGKVVLLAYFATW